MMIALAGAAVVLLVAEHAEGFVVPQNQKMPFSTTTRCMALPTPEESAQALSNYMAKSHEEKLRAVKEVEAKTGAEIKVRTFFHSLSYTYLLVATCLRMIRDRDSPNVLHDYLLVHYCMSSSSYCVCVYDITIGLDWIGWDGIGAQGGDGGAEGSHNI
jgi:hypothetical protein